MALGTPTLLGTPFTSDTDSTTYSTNAVTPTAGGIIFVASLAMLSSGAQNPTVVDSGANAFTRLGYTQQTAGVDTHLMLHYILADDFVSGSTITFTYGSTMSSFCAIPFEITGAHLTTPALQVEDGTVGTGTTAGDSFTNPFSDAGNITLLLVSTRQQQTITPDGSLTELAQVDTSVSPSSLSLAYLIGEDASPSATISSADWAALIAEIQAQPAAPAGGVYPHRRYYQRHGG